MLPEILNSNDGGIGVLNRLGMDKSFMNEMQKRYGSYASKIGLNGDTIQNTISAIGRAMENKSAPVQSVKKSAGFDSSKYHKL